MSAQQRDIHVGAATVPYAKTSGGFVEGWVIPGGKRTTDFEYALKVAKNIDKIIKQLKGK